MEGHMKKTDGDPHPESMDVDAGNLPLVERLEALLDNDKVADVVFVVGDPMKTTPIRIPAISGLLIAASDAFKAMFIGEFPRPSEVPVPDGDPDAFHIVLRYVYTDRLKLELDCALPVMYLAKKYMLTRLIAEATELVSTLLSTENVCQLLPYIGLVEEISERQTKELSAENTRETMGELLFLVRFPLMTAQEFAAANDQCSVLTNEETLSVYKYFATCVEPDWFSCASRAKQRSHFAITFSLTGLQAFAEEPDQYSRVSQQVGHDNLKWCIMAKLEAGATGKKLGFFLKCEGPEVECSWSSRADATMRILSYRAQTWDIIRRTEVHAYTDKEHDWGYKSFADIQDLLNPSKGFLHDDTILMSIDVFPQADQPSHIHAL